MQNWIKSMFVMLCGMMLVSGFTACGGGGDSDDDDRGGGGGSGYGYSGQWYIPSDAISQKVNTISEDINSYGNGMLQADFFESDGKFVFPQFRREERNDGVAYGYPVDWGNYGLAAIHFISDNTIEACFSPEIWKKGSSGTTGKTLLYEMDMGFVGYLSVCASYTKLYTIYPDGNGFWFGDENEGVFEFNDANGRLYMNGGSTWVEYNPYEYHKGNVTVTAGKSGGTSGGGSSTPLTEISLKNWLTKVMGTLNVNPQTDSYSSILTALDKSSYKYTTPQYYNSTDTYLDIVDFSGEYHLAYKGIRFYSFTLLPYSSGKVYSFSYAFSLSQNSYTSRDQMIEDVLSDFKAMGYQLYLDTSDDFYDVAYDTNPNSTWAKKFYLHVSGYSFIIGMTDY